MVYLQGATLRKLWTTASAPIAIKAVAWVSAAGLVDEPGDPELPWECAEKLRQPLAQGAFHGMGTRLGLDS